MTNYTTKPFPSFGRSLRYPENGMLQAAWTLRQAREGLTRDEWALRTELSLNTIDSLRTDFALAGFVELAPSSKALLKQSCKEAADMVNKKRAGSSVGGVKSDPYWELPMEEPPEPIWVWVGPRGWSPIEIRRRVEMVRGDKERVMPKSTLKKAVRDLGKLYKTNPKAFTPELLEMSKWLKQKAELE